MNSQIKSLALTLVTSVGIMGAVNAQEKEMAEKPMNEKVAEQKEMAKLLGVGSDAPALEGVTWVQGEEVKDLNEKGKLYIIECWASWCGPCVAVIPHMNELHKKYAEQGLVLIGMNVWEEGLEKTQAFVKKQGEGMTYRVAYSGEKGSKFESAWLEASNTQGIPQAFVVKDGKIIYSGHPGGLNEKTIEEMLKEGFNADEYAKKQESEKVAMQAFSEKIQALFQAEDWAAIKKLAMTDEYIKGKSDAAGIISHANQQLGDWDAQSAHLKEVVAGNFGEDAKATVLIGYSLIGAEIDDKVIAIAKEIEQLYATEGEPEKEDYPGRVAQSRVFFMVGKTAEAKEILQGLVKELSEFADDPGAADFSKKLNETIKSIDEGKYPPFN